MAKNNCFFKQTNPPILPCFIEEKGKIGGLLLERFRSTGFSILFYRTVSSISFTAVSNCVSSPLSWDSGELYTSMSGSNC